MPIVSSFVWPEAALVSLLLLAALVVVLLFPPLSPQAAADVASTAMSTAMVRQIRRIRCRHSCAGSPTAQGSAVSADNYHHNIHGCDRCQRMVASPRSAGQSRRIGRSSRPATSARNAASGRPVEHPMIKRETQSERGNGSRLALLPRHAIDDTTDAEDGHVWRVDDRREGIDAGEAPSDVTEKVAPSKSSKSRLPDRARPTDRARQRPARQAPDHLRPDHGNHQAVVESDGETKVHLLHDLDGVVERPSVHGGIVASMANTAALPTRSVVVGTTRSSLAQSRFSCRRSFARRFTGTDRVSVS